MEFDPLDLISPLPSPSPENTPAGLSGQNPLKQTLQQASTQLAAPRVPVSNAPSDTSQPTSSFHDDVDQPTPLDPLDLPLLQLQPPAHVLIVLLALLEPEVTRNFEPLAATRASPEEIFLSKGLAVHIPLATVWLEQHAAAFSPVRLAAHPPLLHQFKTAHLVPYNGWLTRIIASPLPWISESERLAVHKSASLRLAENCGRTAQPELVRVIEIAGLPHQIRLKEPSLTADNLGLKTWGSSFILASRLAQSQGQTYLSGLVLELGAGTGLVGMVSALLGYPTTLTDLPEIVPNLKDNVELNGVGNVAVEDLDWSDPSTFLARGPDRKFSTIILSDPLYSSCHPPWIVNMVSTFLTKENGVILIQVPLRQKFEFERSVLWSMMENAGFQCQEESIEQGYDDFGSSSFVFKKYAWKLLHL